MECDHQFILGLYMTGAIAMGPTLHSTVPNERIRDRMLGVCRAELSVHNESTMAITNQHLQIWEQLKFCTSSSIQL